MVFKKPPTTLSVAKTVSGKTVWYDFNTNMNGAQRNQARAQTVVENMRIFLFSIATNSAVQVDSTHMLVEVAVLMAIVGIISRLTTWASFTAEGWD